MKRLTALIVSLLMVFTLAMPVWATESDDTASVAADTTASDVVSADGTTESQDGTTEGDGTTDTATPAAAVFSGSTQKVKVPGSSISFTMPSELKYITYASPESELSDVGISRESFLANNYVFFVYSEDESNPVYFQMTRSKNDYSKYIKDYKRLSSADKQSMIDDALSIVEYNQYTYTQSIAYTDAEFVKLAGMQCLKKTGSDGTIELTTVKNGYTYNITYSYNDTMAASDITLIENMVKSLKVANPIDVTSVLLYVALALIVLLIAAFVVLYIKFTALNSVFMSMFEECCDDECECGCCGHDDEEDEEEIAEAEDEDDAENEKKSFDDSDFAEPYNVSDTADEQDTEDNAE